MSTTMKRQNRRRSHLLRRYPLLSVALLLSTAAANPAHAVNINFSFSTDPSTGGLAGTVTGQIQGLVDNTTSAATAVIIDSYPAGLVLHGTYTTPFNVLAWAGAQIVENSFTLSNGAVTGASFAVENGNGDDDQLYIDSPIGNHFGLATGTNFLDIGNSDGLYVWNDNGIGPTGVTFGQPSSIPEPTSLMLAACAGLLCLAFRCTKKMPPQI